MNRRTPALLIVPFLILGGALAVSALLNRGHSKDGAVKDTPPTAVKPGTGIVVGKITTGFKPPVTKKGRAIFSQMSLDNAGPVAWGSIELIGSDENFYAFIRNLSLECKDETGNAWPLNSNIISKTLYYGIDRGYSSTAKRVTVTLKLAGKQVAQVQIPLPKPKPLAPPPLISPWKGLVGEACYPYGFKYSHPIFYVDAPLENGHILAAALNGTTYSRESTNYWKIVKGPDAGAYNQMVEFPLRYPEAKGKAYIDVVEFAPTHIHKILRFKSMASVDKFGSLWAMGPSSIEKFSDGVFFRLSGNDKVPFRAPDHPRRVIVLWLEESGFVRHVVATLSSPTSARSIPFLVRHDALEVEKVIPAVPGVDWKSGPLEFIMDVEADVYHEVRHATLAVDRSSPTVRHLPPGQFISGNNLPKEIKLSFPQRH